MSMSSAVLPQPAIFTVTVSARTITPVGTVYINDQRPRTPSGAPAVTLSSGADGTQFDIYAQSQANNTYGLLALAHGTGVAGRTDVVAVGYAYDYPSKSMCQFVPLSGGAQDAYVYLATDGVHVRPFGGVGYAQFTLDSQSGNNNLIFFSSNTTTHIFNNGVPGTTNEMDVVAGGLLYLSGGAGGGTSGVSVYGAGSGTVSVMAANGTATFGSNGSGNVTVQTFSGILYDQANDHEFFSGNGVTQYAFLNSSVFHHNTAITAPSKTFVVPHPAKDGWLFRHGAVEMPEWAVKYRCEVTLDDDGTAEVPLPDYYTHFIDHETASFQLTPLEEPIAVAWSRKQRRVVSHDPYAPGVVVQVEMTATRRDLPPMVVEEPATAPYDPATHPHLSRINAMRRKHDAPYVRRVSTSLDHEQRGSGAL